MTKVRFMLQFKLTEHVQRYTVTGYHVEANRNRGDTG